MSSQRKKRSKVIVDSTVERDKTAEETGGSVLHENPEAEVSEPVNIEMATLSVEELTALQNDLETAQQQSKEYYEGWQRERADFLNYKKRIERDQTQLHQVISANILKKFLAVLDDMELAVKNRPQAANDLNWWEGVELISRKLQGILEAEGVKRIPAEGEFFDPNWHEAISHEENPDFESGKVIEVIKQGYTIGDRIIRPALVRVAR